MSRKLPSMNALVAFEAAARHESFTKAAEELFVTQGAISHQVKALETELGLKLFHRRPQQLVLTNVARDYLIVVRDALDRIATGTNTLIKRQSSGVLTVSMPPNFASKWLVHRLGRFAELFPQIDLRISASEHHIDFAQVDVDLAVRYGVEAELGYKSNLHLTKLYTGGVFPICSPKYMSGEHSLNDINNLKHQKLLHFEDRKDWLRWLNIARIEDVDVSHGPVFDQVSMIIDAAVEGQGIALARGGLATRDLISGQLVRPSKLALKVESAYWIVCPPATANLPKIELFRNWLLQEAAEDEAKLAKLYSE